MVKLLRKSKGICLLIVLCIFAFYPVTVNGQKPLVFDDALLFSEEEKIDLDTKANALSDHYNMDIVVVTTSDANGKTTREYADDYFDYGGFGVGESYDGILFLIDMENREAYISTSGTGIKHLTDERVEAILDRVFDYGLSQGDYYGATMEFLNGAELFLEKGIPSDQYNEVEKIEIPNRITEIDVIISLIGGLTTGSIFYFAVRSKYKGKSNSNQYSYRNNSIVRLTSNQDRLVNTFVTHRIIPKPQPKNNSSKPSTSGRSTVHKSSSGRTHGGGGRKF